MPLPQIPAKGDAARIEQLASGLKKEHGTYGATVLRNPPGRPTGSSTPTAQAPPQPQLPEEAVLLRDAEIVRRGWESVRRLSPGTPWVEIMAANSDANADAAAEGFFVNSPNFE